MQRGRAAVGPARRPTQAPRRTRRGRLLHAKAVGATVSGDSKESWHGACGAPAGWKLLAGSPALPRLHHADISRAAVQVLREYTGHGPTNARIGALRAQVRPLWSVWTAGVRIFVAHAKA